MRGCSDETIRAMLAAYSEYPSAIAAKKMGCTPRDIRYAVEVARKRNIPIPALKAVHGRRWSPDEDAVLIAIWTDGESGKVARAHERLNRPSGAISRRVEILRSRGRLRDAVRPTFSVLKNRACIDSAGILELISLLPRKAA